MVLQLTDLSTMHPALVWDEIIAATVATLALQGDRDRIVFRFEIEDVPRFGSESTDVEILLPRLAKRRLLQLRRTYERHRLVELAAIAIAGLTLMYAGGHEIRDIAMRGTAADYLVDAEGQLLEIAGRTRRTHRDGAWDSRWDRLSARWGRGFCVCVVEFETPTARLAYAQ